MLGRTQAMGILRKVRVRQIRTTQKTLRVFESLPKGHRVTRKLATWPATRPILDLALGYLNVFDDLNAAKEATRGYSIGGHTHIDNATHHTVFDIRTSDYAALFHLQGLLNKSTRVFDLGGSVGNMFYLYDAKLHFPQGLSWIVYDIEEVINLGVKLAVERGEQRLTFTNTFADAAGSDILLASGSLHYFEKPLYQMIEELPNKPAHVLINRTPLISGPTKATVQDGGSYRVECMLFNHDETIMGFESAGYELVDHWDCPELSLMIIGRPEASAAPYTGMYFRKARSSYAENCHRGRAGVPSSAARSAI